MGSLNWSATRWACFKPELLQCVRGGSNPLSNVWKQVLWFTLVYLPSSSRKVYVSNAANRDCSRLLSKIYNFHCSVLFCISHSLLECIMCLLMFAWIYLVINIHSPCHIHDSFEKKNAFFQYRPASTHRLSLLLPSQYLHSDLFQCCALRTSNHHGSLVGKLDCMGLHEQIENVLFNLKRSMRVSYFGDSLQAYNWGPVWRQCRIKWRQS